MKASSPNAPTTQPARRRTVEGSVALRVRRSVAARTAGEPFTARELLNLGPRASVDQAIHRLYVEGAVERVARGVYVRPKFNQTLGVKVPVAPEKIVAAIARSNATKVSISGAEAARRFGFSTQVPVKLVYDTTGRSRTFTVGSQPVVLRHASQSRMELAATPAGEALAALLYLGRKEVTQSVVETVRARLGEAEYQLLLNHRGAMPAWLSDTFHAAT